MFFRFASIVTVFMVVTGAEYLVLLAVTLLLTRVRNPGSESLNRKLRWVLVPLHIAFIAAIICGASTTLGAFCTNRRRFPVILFVQPCLFLLVLALFSVMFAQGFGLKWIWGPEHRKKFGS